MPKNRIGKQYEMYNVPGRT